MILRACPRIVFQTIRSRSSSNVRVARPKYKIVTIEAPSDTPAAKSAACAVTPCFLRAKGVSYSNTSLWSRRATKRDDAKKRAHPPWPLTSCAKRRIGSFRLAGLSRALLIFVDRRVKMHLHTTSTITAAKRSSAELAAWRPPSRNSGGAIASACEPRGDHVGALVVA